MTGVIVLAGILAIGLLQLWWVLFPPAPDLVAGHHQWTHGRDRAGRRAGTPPGASPLERITRFLAEQLREHRPEFLTTLLPDLAVTGTTLSAWLRRVVGFALLLAVAPTALIALRRARDGSGSIEVGPVIGIVLALLVVVLSIRDLREAANQARKQFTRALSMYLDLVAMSMEAGLGHAQALPAVAQIGTDRTFKELRQTIALAPSWGISAWAALGQLGEKYKIPELVSLRSSIELAHEDGARIKESLVSRANSMRAARLALEVEAANKATDSMRILNMVAAVLAGAYVIGPFILALRGAAS